jgi:hypothetical protein
MRVRHQDILASGISPQQLLIIAKDAMLLETQKPENVDLLITMILNVNVPELTRLLVDEQLVSPNTHINGVPMLFTDVVCFKPDVLRVVLSCEALDINRQLENGITILWAKMPVECLRMLLDDPRTNITQRNSRGSYAIEFADAIRRPLFYFASKTTHFC